MMQLKIDINYTHTHSPYTHIYTFTCNITYILKSSQKSPYEVVHVDAANGPLAQSEGESLNPSLCPVTIQVGPSTWVRPAHAAWLGGASHVKKTTTFEWCEQALY